MMLIVLPAPAANGQHIIAIFGAGLVGGAVVRALRLREASQPLNLPFGWHNADHWRSDFTRIERRIRGSNPRFGPVIALDVVWSAGSAGFGASNDDMRREIAAYSAVVEWVGGLKAAMPGIRLGFHMVSSAGGLFEGQRLVEAESVPRPMRPYGEAKLRQEHLLQKLRQTAVGHIYRPSSVYGVSAMGGRSGLINTLIDNAKKHNPSRIFGGMDTLRDYVLSSDIGAFIARRICQPETTSKTYILASGKPTSMTEMLHIAKEVAGGHLYLRLDTKPSNANHITFRRSALPDDWQATNLETGIRLMARQLSLLFEAGAKRP